MGGVNGIHGSALDIMSLLDTRQGGYVLAIIGAFILPILRLTLDRWVFKVATISNMSLFKCLSRCVGGNIF